MDINGNLKPSEKARLEVLESMYETWNKAEVATSATSFEFEVLGGDDHICKGGERFNVSLTSGIIGKWNKEEGAYCSLMNPFREVAPMTEYLKVSVAYKESKSGLVLGQHWLVLMAYAVIRKKAFDDAELYDKIHSAMEDGKIDYNGDDALSVNHIDGNGWFNSLINLELCTKKENSEHKLLMSRLRDRDYKGGPCEGWFVDMRKQYIKTTGYYPCKDSRTVCAKPISVYRMNKFSEWHKQKYPNEWSHRAVDHVDEFVNYFNREMSKCTNQVKHVIKDYTMAEIMSSCMFIQVGNGGINKKREYGEKTQLPGFIPMMNRAKQLGLLESQLAALAGIQQANFSNYKLNRATCKQETIDKLNKAMDRYEAAHTGEKTISSN